MAKLVLKAPATFKAKVAIPVPGGEPTPVEFEFKHRTTAELDAWRKPQAEPIDDVTTILDMAVGWDLAEPFDRENVEMLVVNYHGAALAIVKAYLKELSQGRLGN